MNFDDQDWESGYPTPRQARNDSTAWKVAAGVAIGVVLGGTLVVAVDRYLPQMALTEPAHMVGAAVRESGERAVPEPSPPLRDSTPQEAQPAPLESQLKQAGAVPPGAGVVAPAAPAVVVERKPARGDTARDEIDRKARAWSEYYKKPKHCVENPGADTLVECANHYIRARREFEAAYRAGSH